MSILVSSRLLSCHDDHHHMLVIVCLRVCHCNCNIIICVTVLFLSTLHSRSSDIFFLLTAASFEWTGAVHVERGSSVRTNYHGMDNDNCKF